MLRRRGSDRGKGSQSLSVDVLLPAPPPVWWPLGPPLLHPFYFHVVAVCATIGYAVPRTGGRWPDVFPILSSFRAVLRGVLTNSIGHSAVPCRFSKEALSFVIQERIWKLQRMIRLQAERLEKQISVLDSASQGHPLSGYGKAFGLVIL